MPFTNILHLHDSQGNLAGVFIPASIWQKIEPAINNLKTTCAPAPDKSQEEFAAFLQCWDFRYPYDPSVLCPYCQAFTPNWQNDDLFLLHTANIGGLLVFKCSHCGATIRQKHFKDKRVTEFTR